MYPKARAVRNILLLQGLQETGFYKYLHGPLHNNFISKLIDFALWSEARKFSGEQ